MKQIVILLFPILCLLACDPVNDTLIIFNGSSDTIYFTYTNSDFTQLFDTAQENAGIRQSYLNYIDTIAPHSRQKQIIPGGGNAWERYMLQYNPMGKLNLYTFEREVLEKNSWEEVITKKKYKTKQTFTLEDIKKNNWEVRFSK